MVHLVSESRLPATVTEVQSISDALPDTTNLVANDFSRQATESQMRNKNVVHLSIHAEFNKVPINEEKLQCLILAELPKVSKNICIAANPQAQLLFSSRKF